LIIEHTFKVLGDLEGNESVASLRRCERILGERGKGLMTEAGSRKMEVMVIPITIGS